MTYFNFISNHITRNVKRNMWLNSFINFYLSLGVNFDPQAVSEIQIKRKVTWITAYSETLITTEKNGQQICENLHFS